MRKRLAVAVSLLLLGGAILVHALVGTRLTLWIAFGVCVATAIAGYLGAYPRRGLDLRGGGPPRRPPP
jgi:hypothetical protein